MSINIEQNTSEEIAFESRGKTITFSRLKNGLMIESIDDIYNDQMRLVLDTNALQQLKEWLNSTDKG